jgi:hypothetical protein
LKSGILNSQDALLYLLAKAAVFLNSSSAHYLGRKLQDTPAEFHEVGWLSVNLKNGDNRYSSRLHTDGVV